VVNKNVDVVLQALADPTRRRIVERLMTGSASVMELARPMDISLPAVMRHLSVLEHGGLVVTRKTGRVRSCEIRPEAFRQLEDWLATLRISWERRLDALGDYLGSPPVTERGNSKGGVS
jgi:DNA-binding transcriptional ArsR family regulator